MSSNLDRLWQEYSVVFRECDDHSLARWMAQTLGQLQGRVWRLSHPLLGAYRLAAQVADDRQIWLKRLATPPMAYPEASCCRSPLLPLFTRDVVESGLVCQHCGETAVPFEDLPEDLQLEIRAWAGEYEPVHTVAHWKEDQRKGAKEYDSVFEEAASKAEKLLSRAGSELAPRLLEHYPAVIWEDHDECLDVHPEDVELPGSSGGFKL
jgi:hypothetical protein